ncbi:protein TRIGALACTOSYLDIACYLGLYCEROL 4, chloroplastic-like [Coffea arabica]|uniref:Protein TRIGALACTOSYLDIACYLGLYCEROL 4, chloroplastic-like n=1 Tax=Coffea arabica TaxID=13443 RepID=A0A6P6VU86_COFAR|nr:protein TRIGALACTOSYLDIACYLGLYCEROL 4, chloroplastic-like [Coffea arabica]
MANLRTAMDAGFWDLNIATPQSLDGVARSIPGDPIPLDGATASRALRIQQLSLLGNGFPLGIIPTWSPTPHKELGSFALHSLVFRAAPTANWWLGLIGQFRPKKLISSIKAEVSAGDEWELPAFRDVARHFLNKSLYSIGLCSQLALTSSASILLSSEKHGERKGRRSRAMLFYKLPTHDITLEAAWPELFIDNRGRYWNVPESISLDCLSLVSESGLRYRFGIHKNGGLPSSVDSLNAAEAPLALLPGFCAKGAVSYEKSKDLWRQRETKEDLIVETPNGKFWRPSYDVRLKEPHSAISGIIGATCASWFGNGKSVVAVESREAGVDHIPYNAKSRSPFSLDMFGSFCYTFQHGKFRKLFGDLSRIDARLDVASVSALAKQISNVGNASYSNAENFPSSPRFNVILQQQVVGPIVFRVDSRFVLDLARGSRGPHFEDAIFSLNYALRLLQSGKVVAWYSPKRKEGMIELRLFEF